LFIKSPNGFFIIGAFLCLWVSSSTWAEAFNTQDQNPFSLIHGQPQPTSATLPTKGELQWSLGLDITNTLNLEPAAQEVIFMDFESYHTRLGFLYGIDEDWALKVDVPYIYYGGGFLDSTVDSWHDTFSLPEGNRPDVPNNQFNIIYAQNRSGTPAIDININSSGGGLGDIQLAAARKLIKSSNSALSLWSSIDLPSGDADKLRGNDAIDVAVWLAGSYRLNQRWTTDANLGVLHPGENKLETLVVEDNVVFGYTGIEWSPHSLFDLRVQLAGHTAFYENSELRILSSTYNIVFGGTIHVDACSDFDIAVSEDLKEGATPDVSFLFNWKTKTGDCSSAD
jgi:hypothetical protein